MANSLSMNLPEASQSNSPSTLTPSRVSSLWRSRGTKVDPLSMVPIMRCSSVLKFDLSDVERICGVALCSMCIYENDDEFGFKSTIEKVSGKSVHVDVEAESPSTEFGLVVSSMVVGSKSSERKEVYANMSMFSLSFWLQGGGLSKNPSV